MTNQPTSTLEASSGIDAAADHGIDVDAIGPGARALLIVAGVILAFGAFLLPMTGESPQGWQTFLAVVGVGSAVVAAFTRGALIVTAAAAVATAGLSLVDTEPTLIGTSIAGIAAFAACETVSLARMWSSVGIVDRAAERIHLRAIAVRTIIGVGAAAVCTVIGLIRLPSPGLIAALGVLAASAVIIGSALRAVGADAPPPPPRPTPTPAPPPRAPGLGTGPFPPRR